MSPPVETAPATMDEAVARAIDEAGVRSAVPIATVIYLEPDIRRDGRRDSSPADRVPMTEG